MPRLADVVCVLFPALVLSGVMILLLARWGDPSAMWLACDVFGWEVCE